MLLLFAGLFLILLGLFSGGVLVAAPLGLVPWHPGAVLWVLFPAFSITGFVLFAIGGRSAQVRSGSLADRPWSATNLPTPLCLIA